MVDLHNAALLVLALRFALPTAATTAHSNINCYVKGDTHKTSKQYISSKMLWDDKGTGTEVESGSDSWNSCLDRMSTADQLYWQGQKLEVGVASNNVLADVWYATSKAGTGTRDTYVCSAEWRGISSGQTIVCEPSG